MSPDLYRIQILDIIKKNLTAFRLFIVLQRKKKSETGITSCFLKQNETLEEIAECFRGPFVQQYYQVFCSRFEGKIEDLV